jgi:hypothetical protein
MGDVRIRMVHFQKTGDTRSLISLQLKQGCATSPDVSNGRHLNVLPAQP